MSFSRPSFKHVKDITAAYVLRLLSFPNSLRKAKILQNFGKDLVEQLPLFGKCLRKRLLKKLLQFGDIECRLSHGRTERTHVTQVGHSRTISWLHIEALPSKMA